MHDDKQFLVAVLESETTTWLDAKYYRLEGIVCDCVWLGKGRHLRNNSTEYVSVKNGRLCHPRMVPPTQYRDSLGHLRLPRMIARISGRSDPAPAQIIRSLHRGVDNPLS